MKLDVLLTRVVDEFPAAPARLVLRAISDAASEFCSLTHIWQAQIADVFPTFGTAMYNLQAPPGLRIVAPLVVRVDGQRLPAAPAEFQRRGHLPLAGTPRSFTQCSPAIIELDRPAIDGMVITVWAALALSLSETSADVPDHILNEYGEAIAAGAKMRMLRQAGQPWSAPETAAPYAATYYTAVNVAKHRVMTSLGQADLRVEPHSW